MAFTTYYGGDPSINPMAGAAAASAQNTKQYEDTMKQFQNRMNAWQSSMTAMDAGFKNAIARQAQYGASRRNDIDADYARNLAQAQASALGRGLYNSTVYDSMARGVNYDNMRSRVDLDEMIMRNRADWDQGRLQYLASANSGMDAIRAQQLQMMSQRNAEPIQNQVIPWNYWQPGGQGYESQRQSQNPYAANTSNPMYSLGGRGGGGFSSGGGSPPQMQNGFGNGTDPLGATNAAWGLRGGVGNMPFGTGITGGSLFQPGPLSGGYYVGGGGWGAAAPAAADYGYG